MNTSDLFEKEIGFIKDYRLQEVVRKALNVSPKCIATIPASSSEKYHSKVDCEVGYVDNDGTIHAGGLVNHVKAVTAIAHSLMDSNAFKDICFGAGVEVDEKTLSLYEDCAIAACILHDSWKASDNDPKHTTRFMHPVLAADNFGLACTTIIPESDIEYERMITPIIYGCIASHMNKWNTSKYEPNVELPIPKTGIEVFVSMCDYIGSRKFLPFDIAAYEENVHG